MNLLYNFTKNSFVKKLKLNRILKSNKKVSRNSFFITKIKNYKFFSEVFFTYKVEFIISVLFSKSNTIVTATDSEGNILFSHAAGEVGFSGKQKKKRTAVLIKLFDLVLSKYKNYFLNFPIALHLIRTSSKDKFVIRHVKKHFNLKVIRTFSKISYNGCRSKKIKRKKNLSNIFA